MNKCLLESTNKYLLECTNKYLLESTNKYLLESNKYLLESTNKYLLESTNKYLLESTIFITAILYIVGSSWSSEKMINRPAISDRCLQWTCNMWTGVKGHYVGLSFFPLSLITYNMRTFFVNKTFLSVHLGYNTVSKFWNYRHQSTINSLPQIKKFLAAVTARGYGDMGGHAHTINY